MKTNKVGFTLIELLVCISIIAILAALLLPSLAAAKREGVQSSCVSNLKQIGIGLRVFSNDNNEKFPWMLDQANGGSLGTVDWTDNFKAASNELETSKILWCPSDKEKTQQTKWNILDGTRHISFFVGLDSEERKAQTILAGDRNIFSGNGELDYNWNRFIGTSIDAFWLNKMHLAKGDIILSDGSTHRTTTTQLRDFISGALQESTNVIFSLPRGVL